MMLEISHRKKEISDTELNLKKSKIFWVFST